MLSYHCGYTFSQWYERLCTLIKDLTFQRGLVDSDILAYINDDEKPNYSLRNNMPGGDTLYRILKKACGKGYKIASNNNIHKGRFTEYWKTVSHVRHCITHSNSVRNQKVITKSKSHFAHFSYYFPNHVEKDGKIYLSFNYENLDQATQGLVEFGLQIFKLLSTQEGLNGITLSRNEY